MRKIESVTRKPMINVEVPESDFQPSYGRDITCCTKADDGPGTYNSIILLWLLDNIIMHAWTHETGHIIKFSCFLIRIQELHSPYF